MAIPILHLLGNDFRRGEGRDVRDEALPLAASKYGSLLVRNEHVNPLCSSKVCSCAFALLPRGPQLVRFSIACTASRLVSAYASTYA